ncbi:Swt1 family HEPN domain-containing protein [Rhodopseudomonas sp.]|uniref:Swt1 family HEPN domain-containing protein n=1 Tax=Rhodopseudomonas sp. TaxID=1078 RepID=UPI0039E4E77D
MIDERDLELFVLKCPVIEAGLRTAVSRIHGGDSGQQAADMSTSEYVKQFDFESRTRARKMSQYYELFYMLENDVRRIIQETLEEAHGVEWWSLCVEQSIKDEVNKNKKREAEAGVSLRSESDIDYTTFGQLGDIIRKNWPDFAGMMSNQSAVSRVMFQLNMLRASIAHCGLLADDEVDRLKLAIKDWFRILAGPA